MDFNKIMKQVKQVVDKRGGTDALKEDLGELEHIAKEKGSLADKAKDAGEALKDPGAPGSPRAEPKVHPKPPAK
jgi:hypothetical protein